jgi:hypothetical protein
MVQKEIASGLPEGPIILYLSLLQALLRIHAKRFLGKMTQLYSAFP